METEVLNLGWLSIIPPLLAITLALIFKDVILALVVGIFSGTLIVSKGNIAEAFTNLTDKIASSLVDGWNIRIILFCALLGGLVGIVNKAGAAQAFGKWVTGIITSRVGTAFATFIFGVLIFIDDYFNSLSVGTAMRPMCDRQTISRAKLSYILDSTAAPICIIAPVSSWVVTVISCLKNSDGFDKLGVGEMTFFFNLIPYNLYVIFALILVVITCTGKCDFGPMARAERRAKNGLGLYDEERYGQNAVQDAAPGNKAARPIDMIIPLVFLIVSAIAAFPLTTYSQAVDGKEIKTFGDAWAGKSLADAFKDTDASYALFYAIMLTIIFTFIYFIARRTLKLSELSESLIAGIRSMVPALIILTLAWTIGSVIKSSPADGGVGLSNFVSEAVKNGSFPMGLIPACIFVVACLIAFSTGTSWGTMGIMIPIAVPLALAACENIGITPKENLSFLYFTVAAAIGGAVYGDHTSPISDTTILSATGAGCPCLEHVSTQLPYATFCAVVTAIGYAVGGFIPSFAGLVVAFCISAALFTAGCIILPRVWKCDK